MKRLYFAITVLTLCWTANADESKRQAKIAWLNGREVGVVFWQHPAGNGKTVESEGIDINDFAKYVDMNDEIDAIYYKLPRGYQLVIYQDNFFRGFQQTFHGNGSIVRIEGLDGYQGDSGFVKRGFHDWISSAKILDPGE